MGSSGRKQVVAGAGGIGRNGWWCAENRWWWSKRVVVCRKRVVVVETGGVSFVVVDIHCGCRGRCRSSRT
jgi:hypothetical protein